MPQTAVCRGDAAVVVRGVSQAFRASDGQSVIALRDIGLTLGEREFVSIVGPSGCGKSTLLRIIAGLVTPTRGSVEVLGAPVGVARHEVGLVFQRPALLPWRDVLGNVLFPLEHLRRTIGPRERERAMDLLSMMGLADHSAMQPRELSGGMQQRVGICRALVTDPRLLLMDEPFAALDSLTREDLGAELLAMCERQPKAVLFVTHSISEAVLLSDRVVAMSPRPGRIRAIFDVPFARPRDADVVRAPEFQEISRDVRDAIH